MAETDLPRTSLLTKYRDSMQELQETLVKEKKWRQEAENENRLLRKKNLEIEEQITDMRYSSVEYMAKIEELISENKKLTERNREMMEDFEKLEDLYDREQVKTETLEKELRKLEDIIQELKTDISNKQRTLEDWKNSFLSFEEQIKALERDNYQLKEENFVYKNAYKDAEYSLETKEQECKNLYENMQKCKEDMENMYTEKSQELEKMMIVSEEKFRMIIQQKDKQIQALGQEIKDISEKKEELEGTAGDFQDQASEALKKANIVKAELHTKNEIIFEITNKNKEMSTEIQKLAEAIEQEKVRNAKEVAGITQQHEKVMSTTISNMKNDMAGEIQKKNQEIEILEEKYENSLLLLKVKEEDIANLNQDREKLQEILNDLDSKLRNLLIKYQTDYDNWEKKQVQGEKCKQDLVILEAKYGELQEKMRELEIQSQEKIAGLAGKNSELKVKIKENKKRFMTEAEEKFKNAEETVEFWKEKFREEVGYMEKWAESIQDNPNMSNVSGRINNIIKRLVTALDRSFI